MMKEETILMSKSFYFSICIFSILNCTPRLQCPACLYSVPCIGHRSVKIPFDYVSGPGLCFSLAELAHE